MKPTEVGLHTESTVVDEDKVNKSFEAAYKKMHHLILQPLDSLQLRNKYHFKVPYQDVDIVVKRIDSYLLFGEVAHVFETMLQDQTIRWSDTLAKVRLENPKAVNLNQKKKGGGYMFPHMYSFDISSQRVSAKPAHTCRDAQKLFRGAMIERFKLDTGLHVYDCDLFGCHARIAASLITPQNGPLIHKANQDENLYLQMATEIKNKNTVLEDFPLLKLRKVVKVFYLAVLNGGGLETEGNLNTTLPSGLTEVDTIGTPLQHYKKNLINILSKESIYLEFRKHHVHLRNSGSVFLMTSRKKRSEKKIYTIVSRIFCSVETTVMTELAEHLGTYQSKILPTIHDGIIFCCKQPLSAETIADLCESFKTRMRLSVGFIIPIEINKM